MIRPHARFTPVQVVEIKALACHLPAETEVPLSRWSCPDLAREATGRGITETMSAIHHPPGPGRRCDQARVEGVRGPSRGVLALAEDQVDVTPFPDPLNVRTRKATS
jgi:hypothetical protein